MNHADLRKNLADYLEGDLALDDRALVDAHLDVCADCSRDVEEMLQTIQLLRTLPEPVLPPMIAANVMRRIRAGEGQPGFFARLSGRLGEILEPSFVLPASAIAAAALVVTVVQGPNDSKRLNHDALSGAGTRPIAASLLSPTSLPASSGADDTVRMPAAMSGSEARRQLLVDASGNSLRRIRIRIDGSGVSRLSLSPSGRQQLRRRTSARLPGFTSKVPEDWANEFSRMMSWNGSSSGAAPGMLVSAERLHLSDAPARSIGRSDTSARVSGAEAVDPRDAWLALGFQEPAEFARYIAGRSLAEQELWANRLSARAEARGLMNEFLAALRESGDPTAAWIAEDFAAQVVRRDSSGGTGVEIGDSDASLNQLDRSAFDKSPTRTPTPTSAN